MDLGRDGARTAPVLAAKGIGPAICREHASAGAKVAMVAAQKQMSPML
jgi:hypothetical protein